VHAQGASHFELHLTFVHAQSASHSKLLLTFVHVQSASYFELLLTFVLQQHNKCSPTLEKTQGVLHSEHHSKRSPTLVHTQRAVHPPHSKCALTQPYYRYVRNTRNSGAPNKEFKIKDDQTVHQQCHAIYGVTTLHAPQPNASPGKRDAATCR
jgi:hypothetical protein